MAISFEQAKSASSGCDSRLERLKAIKALLDATEEAMFNNALQGGVSKYKVNTGQTIIEVESDSLTELRKQWLDLQAFYNEMCGLLKGTNVHVMRDASTNSR